MIDPVFKIKIDTQDESFGRFIFEPLEQGYGQTVGNSLRRVLLGSLPGSAIVSVAIEGVQHQFSALPGMKEDNGEFIQNVKKVRLIVQKDEEATLSVHKTGEGEVTAADIQVPAGVRIVNPDVVLCTLADKKSSLVAEMKVRSGYGYAPVEDKTNHPLGTIPIDALYSPVLRVNYKVESTRVGRMTNLDKLVMEVWTDGTILPYDAIVVASKILTSYFKQIIDPQDEPTRESSLEIASSVSDETLKMRIEEFDIPTRIVNALAKGGIETVGQLMDTSKDDMMKVKNLGSKSLDVVLAKMKEKGITVTLN